MSNPNIVTATSIIAKVETFVLTASIFANELVNDAGSDKVFKINSITACNISDSQKWVRVLVKPNNNNNITHYRIVEDTDVPSQTTLVVLSTDTPIYLMMNQRIMARAQTNDAINLQISYEEIS
jgi:hypothetical protein